MNSFDLAVLNNELMIDSRDIASMTGKNTTPLKDGDGVVKKE